MRPLRLRLRGLRSYLVERELDFSELGLVAIIGPTGAGKSSLLEALIYALYGGTSWDRRAPKALIADTAKTMSVQLTFEAAGKVWEVTRTTSRGTSPPPSHGLICLSDPTEPKIDGEDPVNRRIEALIGLDFRSFCACVLLPQGRFERLLRATPAERTDILAGIFGVAELAELRDHVDEVLAEVRLRREEIIERRGRFLPDPAGEHRRAQNEIDRLTPQRDTLAVDVEEMVELRETARKYADQAKRTNDRAAAIEDMLDGQPERLAELAQRDAERVAERQRLATAHELAARADRDAHEAEREAAGQQRDLASVRAAAATLQGALTEVRAIEQAAAALAGDEQSLAQDREAHAQQAAELERFKTAAALAASAYTRAQDATRSAEQALAEAERHRDALALATEQLTGAEAELDRRQLAATTAQKRHNDSATAHEKAKAAEAEAERALAQARRDHAAAEVAAGCHPGDPCPVCRQTLPADFTAPPDRDLLAAEEACRTARAAASTAQATLATHAEQLRGAGDQASDAETDVRKATEALRHALREARAALELDDVPQRDAAQAASASVEAAKARQAELAAAEEQAQRAAEEADRAHEQLMRSHERAESALGERAKGIAKMRASLQERRAALPTRLTEVPGWVAIDPKSSDEAALVAAQERVEKAQNDAQALANVRTRTSKALRDASSALSDHDEATRTEVREPALGERESLRALLRELQRDQVEDLEQAPPPVAAIEQLAVWAQRLAKRMSGHVSALRANGEAADNQAKTAIEAARAIVAKHDAQDSQELERRLRMLAARVLAAEMRRDRAAAQVEPVAQLETLMTKATELERGLSELSGLLVRGRFIGHVVTARQRALLALASGILQQITGGRFGFTAAFEIVDTRSGLARRSETLSGGETFLASLALALGLVELMGRTGGALRALFLDEGFGSLDPNALDEALDVLEARARAGRLIAIISHVPAIAERIETVLQVVPRPEGSEIRHLDATQREQLAIKEPEKLAA